MQLPTNGLIAIVPSNRLVVGILMIVILVLSRNGIDTIKHDQVISNLSQDNSVPIQQLPVVPICTKSKRLILQPFVDSGLEEANYTDVCGIPFVRLHRSLVVDADVVLMLVQIKLADTKFNNLLKVVDFYIDNIYIVYKIFGTPGHYQIKTNQSQTPFNFFIFNDTVNNEVVLKQNRNYRLNDTFQIAITNVNGENSSKQVVDTSESFTVTCISITPKINCHPLIDNTSISCSCDKIRMRTDDVHPTNRNGVILPSLVIFFMLVVIYSFAMYDKIHEKPNVAPEEQLNLILCMIENAVYEYNLIFRIGCPTGDFNMDSNYIDFEILGPNDEMVGTPVRFDCSLLPDKICGEMHCLIGRITPMPPIHGIRANHSDPKNFIFFYEWLLKNLSDDTVIERRTIARYIENRQVVFRGRGSNNDDAEDVGLFPELPVMELTRIEALTIIAFVIMLVGCFTMLFEKFDLLYFVSKHEDGSMFRTMQDVLFVAPIALINLFFVIFVYKYYLKRIHLRYEYSIDRFETSFWHHVCHSFLIFLVKICIVCAVIFIYFGLQITFVLSAYWYTSVLLTGVVVLGIWAVANKCLCLKNYYEEHPFFVERGTAANQEKTVYFNSNHSQNAANNTTHKQKTTTKKLTTKKTTNKNTKKRTRKTTQK